MTRDLDNAYIPMGKRLCIEDHRSDPQFAKLVGGDPYKDPGDTIIKWATPFGAPVA